jgi:hypothetical protein
MQAWCQLAVTCPSQCCEQYGKLTCFLSQLCTTSPHGAVVQNGGEGGSVDGVGMQAWYQLVAIRPPICCQRYGIDLAASVISK